MDSNISEKVIYLCSIRLIILTKKTFKVNLWLLSNNVSIFVIYDLLLDNKPLTGDWKADAFLIILKSVVIVITD